MMRTSVLSICVLALTLFAATRAVVAQQAQGKALAPVTLTGAAEVPGPGDSNGSGTVSLVPDPHGTGTTAETCHIHYHTL